MPSIVLKNLPEDLHAQVKMEAEADFRSVPQEVMARLARSFELDALFHSKRDERWVDEALASGPETPLSRQEMDAIRDRVLRKG